jgi:hypothetical protein
MKTPVTAVPVIVEADMNGTHSTNDWRVREAQKQAELRRHGLLEPELPVDEEDAGAPPDGHPFAPPPATPTAPSRRFPIDAQHLEAGAEARRLLEDGDDASGGERILSDLVVRLAPTLVALMDTEAQLTARLQFFLDRPAELRMLARALKDVTSVQTAISARVENVIGTLSGLRAQRHMLALHRGTK